MFHEKVHYHFAEVFLTVSVTVSWVWIFGRFLSFKSNAAEIPWVINVEHNLTLITTEKKMRCLELCKGLYTTFSSIFAQEDGQHFRDIITRMDPRRVETIHRSPDSCELFEHPEHIQFPAFIVVRGWEYSYNQWIFYIFWVWLFAD